MRIRRMELADAELALDWAAAEGWNPGRRDAVPFRAADPDGFLVGELDDAPAAVVACPRYGDAFGFVGLYIVRPDLRGRGLGRLIWDAGHEHLGDRTVGLDAVGEQVVRYERAGYRPEAHTHRHQGRGPAPAAPAPGEADPVPLADVPLEQVLALDARAFPGARDAFLRLYVAQTGTRAIALVADGAVTAYGVRRRCRTGHKVGPLFAPEPESARAVLAALLDGLAPDEPWWVDVPGSNPAATALAEELGLTPGFRTTRMYRGEPPEYERSLVFGVTTLELG